MSAIITAITTSSPITKVDQHQARLAIGMAMGGKEAWRTEWLCRFRGFHLTLISCRISLLPKTILKIKRIETKKKNKKEKAPPGNH